MEPRTSERNAASLPSRADPPTAAALGWILCAIVSGVALQATDPVTGGRAAALHLAVAAGHLLGIGLLVAALVWLQQRALGRGAWRRRLAVAAGGAGFAALVLPEDLGSFAGRVAEQVPPWVTTGAAVIGAGLALAALVDVGRRLRGRRGRALAVVAGAAVIAIEPRILPGQYPGFHIVLVLGVASLLGSALKGVGLPRLLGPRPRVAILSLSALGLATYVVPVGEQVHYLVVRDGDVVAQVAGRFLPRERVEVSASSADESDWLRSRADLPDVPPTPGLRPAESPVVLLLTVDCMRYDLIGGTPRIELPHLASLREEGVLFERAQAPGSSTVYVIGSIFSGKYYSQLEWSQTRPGGIFPSRDRTPRFPEILARHDVWTVHAGSFDWLDDRRGVARGFAVFDYAELPGPRWKTAEALSAALVTRLREVGDRPAFLYAHFNDPHLPYDRGGTRGTPFERYARETQIVDREIGKILRAIDRLGLRSRTTVIVTADHGEAFGEHGRTAHAGSLYQELTHVPLVVRGPGIEPRSILEPVSLIDLGPTILDLHGVPTPAHFMGESFYPLLMGHSITFSRPLIAQAGHLRSLVTRARLKVVRDVRRGTVEAYDLEVDPREVRNLVGEGRADVTSALSVLDAFFQVHQFRRPGYVEPFR